MSQKLPEMSRRGCEAQSCYSRPAIARYILNQYPSTPAQLKECVARAKYQMSMEKKNEFNILFNSSYWIAKEGLAFAKFASLCKLQAKNGLSAGENYINLMGCRMFIKAISETLQESNSVDMKNCRFRAYLSDGSTDAGIREQEIVYCHYVKEGHPITKFFGMQHLEHAHADGTLAAIEKVVSSHLDNTDTMYQKMVLIATSTELLLCLVVKEVYILKCKKNNLLRHSTIALPINWN